MKNKSEKNIYNLLILVCVLAVGGCGYFAYSWWQLREKTPEVLAAKAEAEKRSILNSVESIIYVPDEEPVIYKVDNADQMRKGQPFFKMVQDGDILLVYKTEGKAIIYRPLEKKIVNTGPINIDKGAEEGASDFGATETTPVTTKKAKAPVNEDDTVIEVKTTKKK